MRSVIELEAMGFRFFVDEGPDPSISYDAPETAYPPVALFHLRRIQRHKNHAINFIRANNAAKEYVQLYERWEADPDPGNDANYINQLADVATSGNMPFYEDGINDTGRAGWRRWVKSFEQEVKEEERTVIRLPWE